MSSTRRRLAITGAIVGTFLASMDVTVVGTAMPTIVSQLGGLSLYPWVFSIYLLTSTATVPLYGKGADLFGRRPMYFLAVGVFLLGSLLCATANSMEMLILWRAVQGLGAGGVAPVTQTIVGDLYPAAERGKVQGLFASVWAISSVAGPAVGALIVEHGSWPLIFSLNLPFGVVAVGLMMVGLKEKVERKERRLDLLGAGLLACAAMSLMWGLLRAGHAGLDGIAIGSLVASVALTAALVRQEMRHPDPMIPPALLAEPLIAIGALGGILAGAILYGVTSFVPPLIQGVLGRSPSEAGLGVLPLGLAWPLSATLSTRLIKRLGYKRTVTFGGILLAIGALPFFAVGPSMPLWVLLVATGVSGVGLGFTVTVMLIAAQEVVPWNRRGSATAVIQFCRAIGGAVAVAAMGGVLSASLRGALGDRPELMEMANALLDPHRRAAVAGGDAALVHNALSVGLSRALIGLGLAGLLSLVIIFRFPAEVTPMKTADSAG